ncbi:MAG: AtpZ/AtpI family protein [Bacteroidia bacterium]|nr:AtpZ/AtpI family protein [Bacteroidia bacterium]
MEEQETNPKLKSPKNRLSNYAKYSSLALQMAVIILAGVFGGLKLDRWIGWKFPLFTLVLSLTSVSLAIYFAVKDLIKFK